MYFFKECGEKIHFWFDDPKQKKSVVWWCDTLMHVILTWGLIISMSKKVN
jgi:hypothetical protein